MTKLYRATNPQQIIDVFERRASAARNAADTAKTAASHNMHLREAYAWGEAAEILRNTDFAGWLGETERAVKTVITRDPDAPPITKEDYDWPASSDYELLNSAGLVRMHNGQMQARMSVNDQWQDTGITVIAKQKD